MPEYCKRNTFGKARRIFVWQKHFPLGQHVRLDLSRNDMPQAAFQETGWPRIFLVKTSVDVVPDMTCQTV